MFNFVIFAKIKRLIGKNYQCIMHIKIAQQKLLYVVVIDNVHNRNFGMDFM